MPQNVFFFHGDSVSDDVIVPLSLVSVIPLPITEMDNVHEKKDNKSEVSLWMAMISLTFSNVAMNFGKYAIARLPFHLFVCPHGPCGHDTGRTVSPIITKLDTNMDPWSGQKPIVFLGQSSNN